ncbi:hypothetical protein KR074_004409, partial [Drosophila pseudoananassae]
VSSLVDQLDQPWTQQKLVRVIKNNLRPEIRHEILNLDIQKVSELRGICRRREAFMADVKRSQGYSRSTPFKRDIAEFSEDYDVPEAEQSDDEAGIEAFSLLCWNCRKEGHYEPFLNSHRYQDCISDRRVFCYGCGAPNTYKPNCGKCSKNFQAGTSKSQFRPKAPSAVRSQATMTE